MNIVLRRMVNPIRTLCALKQSSVEGTSYSQILSNYKKLMYNQCKSYNNEDPYEKELEELRYQQLPEQEIPEPSADNVYPVTNVSIVGYDCTVVEHYTQYVHNLATHMGINVLETYALPGKTTLIHTIRKQGLSDNVKPKDFTLKEHERVVQVQDLSSTAAPLFLEVLLQNIPRGLVLDIKQHTQEQYQSRYIQREVPDDL